VTSLEEDAAILHALNNLFGKILGAAELALDLVDQPDVRHELETVLRLTEEAAALVAAFRTAAS